MKKITALSVIIMFINTVILNAQISGGTGNNQSTPSETKPTDITSGANLGDVNLFNGNLSYSYNLGKVSLPSGLSFDVNMSYSSSGVVGDNIPFTSGVPYGEGWSISVPTLSISTGQYFKYLNEKCAYDWTTCNMDYTGEGEIEREGQLYWESPMLSIPGVVSGELVFKYKDGADLVFTLHQFDTYVEARLRGEGGNTWHIILGDGTIYEFDFMKINYINPSNQRLNLDNSNMPNAMNNSITPIGEINTWYCSKIYNTNLPKTNVIEFNYETFGHFDFYKAYSEQYKFRHDNLSMGSNYKLDVIPSPVFKEILLTSVVASVDHVPLEKLVLEYEEKKISGLIDIPQPGDPVVGDDVTYFDKMFLKKPIWYSSNGSTGSTLINKPVDIHTPINNFGDWNRFNHTKNNWTDRWPGYLGTYTNDPIPTNPYLTLVPINPDPSYLVEPANSTGSFAFNHSFLESPRIGNNLNQINQAFKSGDFYEVEALITKPSSYNGYDKGFCTFDMKIVSGKNLPIDYLRIDLSNPYKNSFYIDKDRNYTLHTTTNRPVKWTTTFGTNESNTTMVMREMFSMQNLPKNFEGFHIQIGPGGADMDYSSENVKCDPVRYPNKAYNAYTNTLESESAYDCSSRTTSGAYLGNNNASTSPINNNFGVGLPWYSYKNLYNQYPVAGNDLYNFWWTDFSASCPEENRPTKADENYNLHEIVLNRYYKNTYMLSHAKFLKTNGRYDASLPNEGMILVNDFAFDYEGMTVATYAGVNINDGTTYAPIVSGQRNIVFLKAIKQLPIDGSIASATEEKKDLYFYDFIDASFLESMFHINTVFPVLTKIVTNLGSELDIEYNEMNDLDPTIFNACVKQLNSSSDCFTSISGTPPPELQTYMFQITPLVKKRTIKGETLAQDKVYRYSYKNLVATCGGSFNSVFKNYLSIKMTNDIGFEKGFGLVEVEETAPNGIGFLKSKYYFNGIAPISSGEFSCDFQPLFGKPSKTEQFNSIGELISSIDIGYIVQRAFLPGTHRAVHNPEDEFLDVRSDGTPTFHSEVYIADMDYLNNTRKLSMPFADVALAKLLFETNLSDISLNSDRNSYFERKSAYFVAKHSENTTVFENKHTVKGSLCASSSIEPPSLTNQSCIENKITSTVISDYYTTNEYGTTSCHGYNILLKNNLTTNDLIYEPSWGLYAQTSFSSALPDEFKKMENFYYYDLADAAENPSDPGIPDNFEQLRLARTYRLTTLPYETRESSKLMGQEVKRRSQYYTYDKYWEDLDRGFEYDVTIIPDPDYDPCEDKFSVEYPLCQKCLELFARKGETIDVVIKECNEDGTTFAYYDVINKKWYCCPKKANIPFTRRQVIRVPRDPGGVVLTNGGGIITTNPSSGGGVIGNGNIYTGSNTGGGIITTKPGDGSSSGDGIIVGMKMPLDDIKNNPIGKAYKLAYNKDLNEEMYAYVLQLKEKNLLTKEQLKSDTKLQLIASILKDGKAYTSTDKENVYDKTFDYNKNLAQLKFDALNSNTPFDPNSILDENDDNPDILKRVTYSNTDYYITTFGYLQLRATSIQVDDYATPLENKDFKITRFSWRSDGTRTGKEYFPIYPYENLTKQFIYKRNYLLQPEIILDEEGLITRYYYKDEPIHYLTRSGGHFTDVHDIVDLPGVPYKIEQGHGLTDHLDKTYTYTPDMKVLKVLDPNGITASNEYDKFGRLSKQFVNGVLLKEYSYSHWDKDMTATFKDKTKQNYVETISYIDATMNPLRSRSFIDPLGRQSAATAQVYNPLTSTGLDLMVSGVTKYDMAGRKLTQFKPFYIDATGSPIAPDPVYNEDDPISYPQETQEITYTNDMRNRSLTNSDYFEPGTYRYNSSNYYTIISGTKMQEELALLPTEIQMICDMNKSRTYFIRNKARDENGIETYTYTNANGQVAVTAVCNGSGAGGTVVTLFKYDAWGNVAQVLNPEKQLSTYKYNLQNLMYDKTTVDDGRTQYQYTRRGAISGVFDNNMRNSNDQKFRKYEYDQFGRMVMQYMTNTVQNEIVHMGDLTAGSIQSSMVPFHPFNFDYENTFSTGSGVETGRHATLGNSYDWLPNATSVIFHLDCGGCSEKFYTRFEYVNQVPEKAFMHHDVFNPSVWYIGGTPVWIHTSAYESYRTNIRNFVTSRIGAGVLINNDYALGKPVVSTAFNNGGLAVECTFNSYNTEGNLATEWRYFNPTEITATSTSNEEIISNFVEYNLVGGLKKKSILHTNTGSNPIYAFVYDAYNKLVETKFTPDGIDANLKTITKYNFDPAIGLLNNSQYFYNGVSFIQGAIYYEYDKRLRVKSIGNKVYREILFYDNEEPLGAPSSPSLLTFSKNFNGNINGVIHNYILGDISNRALATSFNNFSTVYGYTYDNLKRMTDADANMITLGTTTGYDIEDGDVSYTYDKIGNILNRKQNLITSGSGSTSPTTLHNYSYIPYTNRLTVINNISSSTARRFQYDYNGNMLTDSKTGLIHTEYGRANLPYTLENGHFINYLYDISDQRIYKNDDRAGGDKEYYLGSMGYLDMNTHKWTWFISGAQRDAKYSEATDKYEYYMYDHLGNTRIVMTREETTPGSGVYDKALLSAAYDYLPYGQILRSYSATGDQEKYLTSQHERDIETGYDYRGARFYDADVARFLSLDPMAQKFASWNPYNIVEGNPVSYIDPNGKFKTKFGAQCYNFFVGGEGISKDKTTGNYHSGEWFVWTKVNGDGGNLKRNYNILGAGVNGTNNLYIKAGVNVDVGPQAGADVKVLGAKIGLEAKNTKSILKAEVEATTDKDDHLKGEYYESSNESITTSAPREVSIEGELVVGVKNEYYYAKDNIFGVGPLKSTEVSMGAYTATTNYNYDGTISDQTLKESLGASVSLGAIGFSINLDIGLKNEIKK